MADRILVLRRGRVAGVRDKAATTPDEIIRLIVGVESPLSSTATYEGDYVLDAAIAQELEAESSSVASGWRRVAYGVLANRNLTITIAGRWSSVSSRSLRANS